MGRAGKWLRALLGIKKTDSPLSSSSSPLSATATPSIPKIVKNRWSFVKSYREKDAGAPHRLSILPAEVIPSTHPSDGDSNKRAIAVAAATAAVAEAAVAAAHAAAEVVRLTSSGRSAVSPPCIGDTGEKLAALKIQAHFRAYLARRALRALRALVRLQALVRGNIVRKQTADMLKRMQTMLRVQERVRAVRAQVSDSPPLSSSKSSLCPGPPTPEKFEQPATTKARAATRHVHHPFKHKRTGSGDKAGFMLYQAEGGMWDHSQPLISVRQGVEMDGRMDKILEMDGGGDFSLMRRKTLFRHSVGRAPNQGRDPDEASLCSGNSSSSPRFFSAFSRAGSSRRGSLTPTTSDGPRVRPDHRNYMACTESSRAKARSVSAPRQRSFNQHYERSGSSKRDSSVCSPGYPGSGWLDGFGMPLG